MKTRQAEPVPTSLGPDERVELERPTSNRADEQVLTALRHAVPKCGEEVFNKW